MTSGANFIDDPRKWRVSKSGFSIRTGWNGDKTIIARYPGALSPLDNEHFQKWLDAAFAICDLYNSLLLTDLQRAVIDHDDDMARLDRNTIPAPASPAALRDEAELVDEVQRRMDQVVEAAVEWHQAGREGTEWFEAAEKLGAAIESLLELRAKPDQKSTPTGLSGSPR